MEDVIMLLLPATLAVVDVYKRQEIHIVTTLSNKTEKEQTITVLQRVFDATGRQVTKSNSSQIVINAGTTVDLTQNFSLSSPQRWSIEEPNMYRMETTVKIGSKVTDVYTTPFGIRTFRLDVYKRQVYDFPVYDGKMPYLIDEVGGIDVYKRQT